MREISKGNDNKEGGVETNKGGGGRLVAHSDWEGWRCDTMGLEQELGNVVRIGAEMCMSKSRQGGLGLRLLSDGPEGHVEQVPSASGPGSRVMQPGTIFHLALSPPGSQAAPDAKKHTPTLVSIAHNAFTIHLLGTLQSTFSPSSLAFSLRQGRSSAGILAGAFDFADPNGSTHVVAPLTGKTVGLHLAVWLSGVVVTGDTIVVLSQQ